MDSPSNVTIADTVQNPGFEKNILSLAKGGGITFAGKMFLAVTRLVAAVLLTRLLGAEQYGMYTLAISVGTILSGIAVFGLDTALIRYIAIQVTRKDEAGIWGTIQVGAGTASLLSVLTGIGLFAFSYPVADQVFHNPQLAPLFQLISVFIPLWAMSDILAGACRGFKRMDYPVIAMFVAQPVIRLVLILVLAVSGLDAWQAVITFGLADLCATIMLLYFLNKEFPLKRPLNPARRDVRSILGFSLPVWLSELMIKFQNNLQVLVLGSMNTIAGVGVFSVASQITVVSGQFSSSLNTSAKPIIAELHHRKDMVQMERIYQTTNKWSLIVQLPVFLTLVLFSQQLLSIFGEDFAAGANALIILAFSDLISVSTGMGGIIIDMTGYTKLKLINSIIRLAIYLGLSVVLIPQYGIVGAATVSLFGEGVVNLLRLIEVYILFRILPYNMGFVKPILAAILSLVSLLAIGLKFPVGEGVVTLILHVAALFAIYAAGYLMMGLSQDDREMLALVRNRARSFLSRS